MPLGNQSKGLLLSAFVAICCTAYPIAMVHTRAANVLVILALAPLFSALIERFVFKCRLAGRTWFAMLLCLLGVVILFADGVGAGSHFGDLIAFFAAIFVGVEFCLMGRVRPESLIPALGLGCTLPALFALPFVAGLHVPAQSLGPVLFMGLVIAPVSFILISKGPQYLPAPEVALFLLLETVGGSLLVWAVLGEEPGRYALAGGVIILGTLAWHSTVDLLQERRQAAPLRSWLLLPSPSLRAPLGRLGLRLAFHESLLPLDEIAASEGRDVSGSILLNGITLCVSPMMCSRHPMGHAVKRGLTHQ